MYESFCGCKLRDNVIYTREGIKSSQFLASLYDLESWTHQSLTSLALAIFIETTLCVRSEDNPDVMSQML